MIVVDASALLEALLRPPAAEVVERRLLNASETLHAPHWLDIEVAQVLRCHTLHGTCDSGRGERALEDLAAFPIQRYPHDFLLPRIWQLRHTMTAYGAAYVALAEVLDAPLLTRDRRLAAAAGGLIAIELV